MQLNDGEELIGIYGSKSESYTVFSNLGFIVWKPVFIWLNT